MRLVLILSMVVLSLLGYASGEEIGAFEFPAQKQPKIPKYFDDYGDINTHFGPSATAFVEPSTSVLSRLFKTYALTMRDLGMTTWLAHGSLLSWYWNHHVFPWEADIDMHITLPDLRFMARYYNMTVFQFRFPDTPEGQTNQYVLDINPNYPQRIVGRLDSNRIDARWVDMSNGAYIDITALHPLDPQARDHGRPMLWQTKDGHIYDDADVYPLQRTVFEGVEAFVPNNPEKLSAKEYTDNSLTQNVFRGYKFDKLEHQWIAISPEAAG